MLNQQIRRLMDEFPGALLPYYQAEMQAALEQHGLPPRDWFTLYLLLAIKPQPATAQNLAGYLPYSSPAFIDGVLERAAGDLIEGDPQAGYLASAAAEKAFYNAADDAQRAIDRAALVEPARLQRMAETLERLVTASLQAAEPRSKRHLERSRLMATGPQAGWPSRIDQAITDLYAFRDDAHQASWQDQPVDGHAWELLTLVWREAPQTLEALLEKVSGRGFEADETRAALDRLIGLGWLEEQQGELNVTAAGAAIREAAEVRTDTLYFGPWEILPDAALEELREDLEMYISRLREEHAASSEAQAR